MAERSLNRAFTSLARLLDAVISRALRYDLSRTDVLNWIGFARNLFLVLLVSVTTIAGLAGWAATRQAGDLLRASLLARGRTIADAVAGAAFVPLSLEDDAALGFLLVSYRGTADLVYLRIRDASGRVRRASTYAPEAATGPLLEIEASVAPSAGPAGSRRTRRAAGIVTAGMSEQSIRRESRRIALFNLGGSVLLAAVVLAAGLALLRRVIERMRELVGEARLARALQQANAELESFSYSVSHDLRAPLRTVDGFSHILLEDYAGALDDQGRDYLTRVRQGCRRMGVLIDDLLKLSRVIRQELRREKTDLAAVARGIMDQLRAEDLGRRVEFVAPQRLPVEGDPGLLRAVLENLLGNAWKFTVKRPDARIEFGVVAGAGETVYVVRDNGAGFDMAYARKLFGAFQRLHSQAEFPGTGIGLATVQRIVARHGGRIWAEGEVGRGASFYFTLG